MFSAPRYGELRIGGMIGPNLDDSGRITGKQEGTELLPVRRHPSEPANQPH
jgi:hypothetical protein